MICMLFEREYGERKNEAGLGNGIGFELEKMKPNRFAITSWITFKPLFTMLRFAKIHSTEG